MVFAMALRMLARDQSRAGDLSPMTSWPPASAGMTTRFCPAVQVADPLVRTPARRIGPRRLPAFVGSE